MEAKVLRIGNIAEHPNGIDAITDFVSEIARFKGGIKLEAWHCCVLKPIPLTEEWLLKFGFKQYNGKFTYDLEKLSICLSGNEYKNGRTYFNSWCIIESQPLHVHQLQNLYFALTGVELLNKKP